MFFASKNIFVFFSILVLLGFAVSFFVFQKISIYQKYVYASVRDIPHSSVALIFGAGVKPNGKLSDALSDRVSTGVELYKMGKVTKLLMSGDNGSKTYDEVTAMKNFAVEKGVNPEDVVLDYAGFDTYDTCYRAKEIFDLKENVILVTQAFHLPRALYICNRLGVKSVGVVADKRQYVTNLWGVREFLARTKAWLEVEVIHSKPKFLGKKEPIFHI